MASVVSFDLWSANLDLSSAERTFRLVYMRWWMQLGLLELDFKPQATSTSYRHVAVHFGCVVFACTATCCCTCLCMFLAAWFLLWWFGHWWLYNGLILFVLLLAAMACSRFINMARHWRLLTAARYTEDIFCRLGAWEPMTRHAYRGASYVDMWKRLGSKIADELQVAAETSGGSIARGSSCVHRSSPNTAGTSFCVAEPEPQNSPAPSDEFSDGALWARRP